MSAYSLINMQRTQRAHKTHAYSAAMHSNFWIWKWRKSPHPWQYVCSRLSAVAISSGWGHRGMQATPEKIHLCKCFYSNFPSSVFCQRVFAHWRLVLYALLRCCVDNEQIKEKMRIIKFINMHMGHAEEREIRGQKIMSPVRKASIETISLLQG